MASGTTVIGCHGLHFTKRFQRCKAFRAITKNPRQSSISWSSCKEPLNFHQKHTLPLISKVLLWLAAQTCSWLVISWLGQRAHKAKAKGLISQEPLLSSTVRGRVLPLSQPSSSISDPSEGEQGEGMHSYFGPDPSPLLVTLVGGHWCFPWASTRSKWIRSKKETPP